MTSQYSEEGDFTKNMKIQNSECVRLKARISNRSITLLRSHLDKEAHVNKAQSHSNIVGKSKINTGNKHESYTKEGLGHMDRISLKDVGP